MFKAYVFQSDAVSLILFIGANKIFLQKFVYFLCNILLSSRLSDLKFGVIGRCYGFETKKSASSGIWWY